MAYYNRFNETADEFFKNLIEGFPQTDEYNILRNEFRTLKSGYHLLKSIDERKPQKVFSEYVVPKYKDKIMNKDDTFFLEKEDFDITSRRKEYWMDFIGNIKSVWVNMDDENKEVVWKFFKVLVLLSDKCDGK